MKKQNKEANQSLSVKRKELGMLDKGTIACALISSSDRPFVTIPVKCVIEDAYFIDTTLFYVIKIMMFYDTNAAFLLENIRNMKFKIGKGYDKFRLIRLSSKIKNANDINNYFTTEMTGTHFHVESCFVRKNKVELFKLFDRIQDYLIFKHLRTVESLMSRTLYSGKLKMKNENEFKIRMERGFNSLFGSNEETKEFFDLMYVTNSTLRNRLDESRGIKTKEQEY